MEEVGNLGNSKGVIPFLAYRDSNSKSDDKKSIYFQTSKQQCTSFKWQRWPTNPNILHQKFQPFNIFSATNSIFVYLILLLVGEHIFI